MSSIAMSGRCARTSSTASLPVGGLGDHLDARVGAQDRPHPARIIASSSASTTRITGLPRSLPAGPRGAFSVPYGNRAVTVNSPSWSPARRVPPSSAHPLAQTRHTAAAARQPRQHFDHPLIRPTLSIAASADRRHGHDHEGRSRSAPAK